MDVGNSRFVFSHVTKEGKEEKKGKPIVFPAQAELVIDSLDRYHDTATPLYNEQTTAKLLGSLLGGTASGNRFEISVPRNLLYGYFHRLAISQIQMQFRLPTIITGLNDVVYLSKNGAAPVALTMPQGYYTPTFFATTLQGIIRASAAGTAGYTVVYNAVPGGFIFATNTADTTQLWIPNFPPQNITEAQATVALRFGRLLGAGREAYGLTEGGDNTLNPTPTFRTYSPNWLYTDYVDIVSKKLCKFKRVKDNSSTDAGLGDVVARVYLTPVDSLQFWDAYTKPFVTTIEFANPDYCKWSEEEALQNIDFSLYDMWGDLLFWTTSYNTEFQMTLLASET